MAAEHSGFPMPVMVPGTPGAAGRAGRGTRRGVRGAAAARRSPSWRVLVDDAPTALTAGGNLVAAGGTTGTAWVLEAASGLPVATITLPGGIADLAFSPDGSHLVLAGPRGYALWHADDSRATVLASGRRSARARWAGPGQVAVADGRAAAVLDAAGRQLWRTAQLPGTVADLAWLPGGGLAVACDTETRCHQPRQAVPAASFALPGGCPTIAVPPGGRWICAGSQDAPVCVWRTSDAAGFTLPAGPGSAARLAFDETGRWLAVGLSPQVTVWDFTGEEPQGRAPRILCAHDTVTALAWRPGGGTILATAGAEGTIALWDATAGKPGRRRTTTAGWGLEDDVTAVAWNGPGMLLAATRNGTLRALDPTRA
jgi:WD40 repeat protein